MPDEVSNEKRAMRAELRERRRICTTSVRETADAALTEHLIQLTLDRQATSIATYLSLPDEPKTRDFIAWACERNISVLLPISRVDGLLDWAPYDGNDEAIDDFGMPRPTSEVLGPIAINSVDLIVVPAAAVDRTGMRMGWGRGYFDKTLGSMENRPPVYAVIFDDELVERVPSELHDQRVDGVVTPSGIVTF